MNTIVKRFIYNNNNNTSNNCKKIKPTPHGQIKTYNAIIIIIIIKCLFKILSYTVSVYNKKAFYK